ncbi:hypothetical protein MSAN_00239400 [Mycena sanguinolenta]|uniref:Transmembrane protein n=1 Tax=Mycena sanguinolenta TaxID=230812 RepID=A0A8H6ZII0_9AGAR|nr:hypothetical protein MSAN_00239400 [Mycena sanguinolenta]
MATWQRKVLVSELTPPQFLPRRLMLLFFLLPLPALLQVVDALFNVSVDDTDMNMITYKGKWEASSTHLSGLDFGGSHTLSSDSTASATFIFTGVAVYYLSPRWPYDVSTRLSIDGGQAVLVNLTDPLTSPSPPGGSESAVSSVAWSATGLANTSHTVVATYGNYIIVDGFIYTVDNGSVPLSSSSASSASSSSSTLSSSLSASATLAAASSGTSTIPSNHKALTVGLGTAFGLAVLIALLLMAVAVYQRRRYKQARSARPKTPNTVLSDWGSYMRGRGTYAPVSTGAAAHGLEMSESDSSRLLYPPSSGRSDPWAPEDAEYEYFSGPASVPSTAMTRNASASASTMGRSVSLVSSPNRHALPAGAMSPVIPRPYADRAPQEPEPDDNEDTVLDTPLMIARTSSAGVQSVLNRNTTVNSTATSLTRAPSAGIMFVVHPVDDPNTPGAESEFRISSPPAYSE